MTERTIRFGVQTFVEVADRGSGPQPHAETLQEAVELGVLTERAGLDVFTVGEHHRVDYPSPSPEMLLAAVAARTERIALGSAVTVLSTDDPVRVYERFSMLDGISGGRAEPILGRGSFTETFGLYGFDLADYEELFEERLELWSLLRAEERIDWSGRTRPELRGQQVFPHSATPGGLTTWVGVGGNPQSVIRAASYGFNLMLAGLGMTTERIAQYLALFEQALERFERPRPQTALSLTGYLADTDARARDEAWPHYEARMARISRERGFTPPSRTSFEHSIDEGLNLIGSPDTVAAKLTELLGAVPLDRVDIGIDTGGLPLESRVHAVELLGQEVAPRVRAALGAVRAG